MGLLVDGTWHDRWYDTESSGGRFLRSEAAFRGVLGSERFPVASGRYHLYVAQACPWAHRTLIFRKLKGLERHIPVHRVHPLMLDQGWQFLDDCQDGLYGKRYLHELYTLAMGDYSGRVTVPVLWDSVERTIVNNESEEIIRQLNSAFDGLTGNELDFWPEALRPEIGRVNARIYEHVNNGVYRCGFATTQAAYDEAVEGLFETLDWLEAHLTRRRFLVGERLTEADLRLLPTLMRFDAVYVTHFKCDHKRLVDYPALWAYTRQLAQVVEGTFWLEPTRRHYFCSHESINPHRILSKGPRVDFSGDHGRGDALTTARRS
jgi:putative glutathione S-transferase